jgi:hypothetical protein
MLAGEGKGHWGQVLLFAFLQSFFVTLTIMLLQHSAFLMRKLRPLGHLADVNAGTDARQLGFIGMDLLEPQRKRHCGARSIEREKTTVSGPLDDASARILGEASDLLSMSSNQLTGYMITALRLQSRRAD